MKNLLLVLLLALGAYTLVEYNDTQSPVETATAITTETSDSAAQLQAAYQDQQSNLQVQGTGTVIKILPDDNKGSRHQRFILQLPTGQTLLVAHNIDLAPRINALQTGDAVAFFGEYEWNTKGGVIHWTHHDPGAKHTDGWLSHNGHLYR